MVGPIYTHTHTHMILPPKLHWETDKKSILPIVDDSDRERERENQILLDQFLSRNYAPNPSRKIEMTRTTARPHD